ncbi:hypothetical protein HCN44_006515 [Aphidius gifuensis]|uniref:HTH CENPB-type domain-containing protein n=1 Tax=Aphidius gifuensis TaxID=684658 RepID=A0A834Y0B2_APHGI|nr:hypothetical protein HCN44_006515 [Aphidius gifuensis]
MNIRTHDPEDIKKHKKDFSDAFYLCSDLLKKNEYCEEKNEKISLKSGALAQQMYKSMLDIWDETLKSYDQTTNNPDKKKPASVTSTSTSANQQVTEELKQTNKYKNNKRKIPDSNLDTDDDDDDYKPPRQRKKQVDFDDKVHVVNLARKHPRWSLSKLKNKSGCHRLSSNDQLSTWMRQVDIGQLKQKMEQKINQWVYDKFIEYKKNNITVDNDLLKQWVYCAKKDCCPKAICSVEATSCWLFRFKKEYCIIGNSNDLFIADPKTDEKKVDVKNEPSNHQKSDKKEVKNKKEPLLVDLDDDDDDDDEQNEEEDEEEAGKNKETTLTNKNKQDQQIENNNKKTTMTVHSDDKPNEKEKENKKEPLLITLDSESSDEEIETNKITEFTIKKELIQDDEKELENKTPLALEVNQSHKNIAHKKKPAAIILKENERKKNEMNCDDKIKKINKSIFKKCIEVTLKNEKFNDETIKHWAIEAANLHFPEIKIFEWVPSDNWLTKFKRTHSIIGQSPNLQVDKKYLNLLAKLHQENKASGNIAVDKIKKEPF